MTQVLNKDQNDEGCDATDDDSSNTAGFKKINCNIYFHQRVKKMAPVLRVPLIIGI
jgi:hypothetical protein